MSNEAINAFHEISGDLTRMIADAELGRNMKPGPVAVYAVGLLLADNYRNHRGYVDETIDQIRKSFPGSVATVKRALHVLHVIDVWVPLQGHRGGAPHAGTRRCGGQALGQLPGHPQLDLGATARRSPVGPGRDSAPKSENLGADLGALSTDLGALSTDLGALSRPSPTPIPQKDNDYVSRHVEEGPGQRSSSSSEISRVISLAAKRRTEIRRKEIYLKSPNAFGHATEQNLRAKFWDRVETWLREGLSDDEIIDRLLFDDVAPPSKPAAHGPDCPCEDGWIKVSDDGQGTLDRCPGMQVAS